MTVEEEIQDIKGVYQYDANKTEEKQTKVVLILDLLDGLD